MNQHEQAVKNAIKLADWFVSKFKQHGGGSGEYRVKDEARSAGMRCLGGGCFSSVYTHPSAPGLVVKVTGNKGYGGEDRGESSITYLAWARANPGPHVPVVHHLIRTTNVCVAVMDQLEELDESNSALFRKHMESYDYKSNMHFAPAAVAAEIREFFTGVAGWDLHKGNVMQDRNGTMIITDPITTVDGRESRILRTGIERAFGLKEAA
jgi:hypothetical protein